MNIKSITVGALSGALAFALLSLAHAQTALTAHDLRQNIKQYVGHEVAVTGLAGPVRHEQKMHGGTNVEYVTFSLNELDPVKNKKTGYNVWISLPLTDFNGTAPTENSMVTVTGVVKWPWSFAQISE